MFNFLRSAPTTPRLTAAEAVKLAAQGEITILDVREAGEVQTSGKAKGALHIPLALVPVKADPKAPDCVKGLDLARPVAVYCASGMRSGRAAQVLAGLGYTAHNIGGLGDWVSAGGTVSR